MSRKNASTKSRHHALALEIARGKKLIAAAKATEYSYEYAQKLNCKPWFKRLVFRLRNDLTRQLTGRIVDGGDAAFDELLKMAKGRKHGAVKLGAAKAILDLLLRYRDACEMYGLAEKTDRALRERAGGGHVAGGLEKEASGNGG